MTQRMKDEYYMNAETCRNIGFDTVSGEKKEKPNDRKSKKQRNGQQ